VQPHCAMLLHPSTLAVFVLIFRQQLTPIP
jgi:hypothetical protein